jgi:hypothetical protein
LVEVVGPDAAIGAGAGFDMAVAYGEVRVVDALRELAVEARALDPLRGRAHHPGGAADIDRLAEVVVGARDVSAPGRTRHREAGELAHHGAGDLFDAAVEPGGADPSPGGSRAATHPTAASEVLAGAAVHLADRSRGAVALAPLHRLQ